MRIATIWATRSAALGVCLAALLSAAEVHAHSGPQVELDELARVSDIVVIGRVAEVVAVDQGPAGQPGIHTRVTLVAEEFLKGVPQSHLTLWVQGGTLGDRRRVVSGQATFTLGERIGICLFEGPAGHLWPQGMAQGKRTLRNEVTGGNPGVLSGGAPNPVSTPVNANRITAAQFRQQIGAIR